MTLDEKKILEIGKLVEKLTNSKRFLLAVATSDGGITRVNNGLNSIEVYGLAQELKIEARSQLHKNKKTEYKV